jgi:hypothetical protein
MAFAYSFQVRKRPMGQWAGQRLSRDTQGRVRNRASFILARASADRASGEVHEAQVFVAVLGASNYTYAEAGAGISRRRPRGRRARHRSAPEHAPREEGVMRSS